MIAELSDITLSEKVKEKVTVKMKELLKKNGLSNVTFTVRFSDQIRPDSSTGKKTLIINGGKKYED